MGTVSEFMLYYNIENINLNDNNYFMKMINEIRNSIVKTQDRTNKILVVKIQDVTSEDSNIIPKLEHKNL